jgi:hypothetical protein
LFDCPSKITDGADVYPVPPVIKLKPVMIPPLIVAVAVAGVVLPDTENVMAGTVTYPLPPYKRLIAVTTPPLIVVVATAIGVVLVIDPLPVTAPIVFPVTSKFPE